MYLIIEKYENNYYFKGEFSSLEEAQEKLNKILLDKLYLSGATFDIYKKIKKEG